LEADADKVKAEERSQNWLMYDVVVAFDPDLSQVSKADLKLMEKWVHDHRGGLVFIASSINTYQLARGTNQDRLGPLLALLPVVLEDSRTAGLGVDRPASKPWPLHFPGATAEMTFLKLDDKGKEPLAGWSEFFYDRPPDLVKPDDPAERGFCLYYPVKSVRPATTVIATFADPKATYTDEGRIALEQ